MKKKLIRMKEGDLHDIITECVNKILIENDLSYSQIKNICGIYDDDELNAAVEAEEFENLEGEIIISLGGLREPKVLDFDNVCDILKNKFGFEYAGNDDEEECHIFKNGKHTIYLYPKTYYPRLGRFMLLNSHLI